jgi:GNAT superfamily N-acetyltransferase
VSGAAAGRQGSGGPAGLAIRRARSRRDLERIARLSAEISPHRAISVEEMRWADRTYPGTVRLLATVGGTDVGTAAVGRVFSYPPEFDAYYALIEVLPAARRQGLGGRLYGAISRPARRAGKSALLVPLLETSTDGLAFLTHRGFVEIERMACVRLDLGGLGAPEIAPPPGVSITTLAARPDLAPAVHEVAVTCWADIPSMDEPPQAGPYEEWVERELRSPNSRLDAYFVALAGSDVVGFADLYFEPGRPGVAAHGMTGVAREWRGRGVASALKRATIAWAIEARLEALEAANDVANAPMRAINARLGYRPGPDALTMRGPLAPRGAGRSSRGA